MGVVCFPVSGNGALTGTIFSVPTGLKRLFVTGLTARTVYRISIRSGGSGDVINITLEITETSTKF
jgi:hypothetical protein